MLILSAVMIYIVSFAGVKSGKLKNDISWTRPIFVALFNDDVNDGCTEKANTPVEVVIKDGKLDKTPASGTTTADGKGGTETIDKDDSTEQVTDVTDKETEAGSGEADLPERTVVLRKAGMLLAGDGGGLRPQGAVDVAEVFLIQKGTAAAIQRKADILSVQGHRIPEPLAQGSRKLLIPPDRVLVQNHLPPDAAAMGTGPRQTGKLIKIIRNTNQHGNSS